MRYAMILVVVATAGLPATAWAGLAAPAEVVPGQEVVITGEAGLIGAPLTLSVDLPGGAFGEATGGLIGADRTARFEMPATFACTGGCEGERRFLPGQRVGLSACNLPQVAGSPAAGMNS